MITKTNYYVTASTMDIKHKPSRVSEMIYVDIVNGCLCIICHTHHENILQITRCNPIQHDITNYNNLMVVILESTIPLVAYQILFHWTTTRAKPLLWL